MSDATPGPDKTEHIPTEPTSTITGMADGPAAAPPRPVGPRWWTRRVPLLLTAAALLLGCFLGAGVTAVGAFVVGEGLGGGDRHHSRNDGRGDGDGRDSDRRQPAPAASTPAAVPTSPAPSAS
jgi:hypothetical protein